MACNLTIEISGSECIGDSRAKINNNFISLENAACSLSADLQTLNGNLINGLNALTLEVSALDARLDQLSATEDISVPIGTIVYAEKAPGTTWRQCLNQEMVINNHLTLYSILSTKYGGNGITTFRLPPADNLKTTHAIGTPFPFSGNCGKATLLKDGRVFFAGQQTSQPYIGVINGSTNIITWQPVTPTLPQSRDGSNTHTLPDGRVMVIAGNNNTVYYGTVADGSAAIVGGWQTPSPPTIPVSQPHPISGFLPDGRLIIVSSTTNTLIGTLNLTAVPINISWAQTTGVPASKNTGGGGVLPDGRVLVTGGENNRSYIGTVTGNSIAWEEVTPFPSTASYYLRSGTILPDGRFFSMGGANSTGTDGWIGTVIGNNIEWQATSRDPYGRWLSTCVALSDGRMLTFGGSGVAGTFFTRFYLYAYIKVS